MNDGNNESFSNESSQPVETIPTITPTTPKPFDIEIGDDSTPPQESQHTNIFQVAAPTDRPGFIEGVEAGVKNTASIVGIGNSVSTEEYRKPLSNTASVFEQQTQQAVMNNAFNRFTGNANSIQNGAEATKTAVTNTADRLVEGVRAVEGFVNGATDKIAKLRMKIENLKVSARARDARVSGAVAKAVSMTPAVLGEVTGAAGTSIAGVTLIPVLGVYALGAGAYEAGKFLTIKSIELGEKVGKFTAEKAVELYEGTKEVVEGVGHGFAEAGRFVGKESLIVARGYKSAYLTESTKVGIANSFSWGKQQILTGIANGLEKNVNKRNAQAESKEGSELKKFFQKFAKEGLTAAKTDCLNAKTKARERNTSRSLGLQALRTRIVNPMSAFNNQSAANAALGI